MPLVELIPMVQLRDRGLFNVLIKKYTGENLLEIQNRITGELGPNAVILTTRTITGGFLTQYFFPEEYEVTVGIDPSDLEAHDEKARLSSMTAIKPLGFESGESKVMRIPTTGPLKFQSGIPNLLILAGPKAVGKTGTAAKLALKLQKETPYKIALFSLQENGLEGLARMFQFEHRLISKPHELKTAAAQLKTHEIFIVDSPSNIDVVDLASYMIELPGARLFLVLSATDSILDSQAAVEKYKQLKPQGLIITKLSDNPDLIMLAELAIRYQLPFCYLSEHAELTLANADDLETRVINEKLRNFAL